MTKFGTNGTAKKEGTFCVNSGKYDGMDFEQARDAVAKDWKLSA